MNNQNFVRHETFKNAGLFKNKQPVLSHLDIELTERCNNACIHCYINLPEYDLQAKSRELNTKEWKEILRQAADLGALSVRFTGGEPLLREDFTELYLYTRRLGMKVILFSNGRLITPELVNLFSKIPPLQKIEISSYGMYEETYKAVTRIPGAFSEFRRGLDLLQDKQIPFHIKTVMLPPIKNEIDEYENWLKTLPGDIKPAYSVILDLRERRDSPKKNSIIKNLRLSPEEILNFTYRFQDDYFLSMIEFSKKFLYPQGQELFNCGAGINGCVDAYGQYQMCMDLRHPDTVVDLKQNSLEEGLLVIFPKIRQIKATNPDYLKRCAHCFIKGLCDQCPAKSWNEHGTLDTPVEYLCQVAHAQARFLGLLENHEKSWEIKDWQARIDRLISSKLNYSSLSIKSQS